MNKVSKYFLFIFLVTVAWLSSLIMPGCANIIPPQGGPRDTIPPVLLKASPVDSARRFTGNRITLSFDEFVEVQNLQDNLIVSPLPKINPVIEYKLSIVTVKLKDSLEPNTTYKLNFGNAIRDFTEGNPVKNFTYTFTTGNYFDSLEIRGKVILAETGKVDTSLTVMLHVRGDDSAVVKEKPRYIARLDGGGNFAFQNLPAKTFYLYALKDEGGSHRYLGDRQLFAFSDKPINTASDKQSITLYAYSAKQATGGATISGNPSINPGIKKKMPGETDKRLRYQTSVVNNHQDLQTPFVMIFEQPLRSFDSSKIRLYTDSAFNPASAYHFFKDSSNKKIQLVNEWKENTVYHVIIQKDFAEDSAGKKLLKTDTISFTTKKLFEYGSLKIKFKNYPTSKKLVLQFVINDVIYKSFPLNSPEFSQTLFLPGEYELRILYDENGNGVWDPGEFFKKHKQPEIVKPVERKISIKAAWQNEFDISL